MRGVLADDSRSEGGQAGGGGKNSAQLGRLELPWWGVLVSPCTESCPEAELELVRWVELSTSASDCGSGKKVAPSCNRGVWHSVLQRSI